LLVPEIVGLFKAVFPGKWVTVDKGPGELEDRTSSPAAYIDAQALKEIRPHLSLGGVGAKEDLVVVWLATIPGGDW